eukprot:TRINITY_DN9947_c0_g1_i4.p1 TRINITY_DN9947_c0_g1~~TRINITY_DN9947_c0_g1_i4.p1  ORF type:complete len:104 (-),score=22.00 TRINITY_DN9947_c0_g1_i4:279-590(-)
MESLAVVPSSLEYAWNALEDLGNEASSGLSEVVNKISAILDDVFTSCAQLGETVCNMSVNVVSDTIVIVEEAFKTLVHPFSELLQPSVLLLLILNMLLILLAA